jgi:hypothetical protein
MKDRSTHSDVPCHLVGCWSVSSRPAGRVDEMQNLFLSTILFLATIDRVSAFHVVFDGYRRIPESVIRSSGFHLLATVPKLRMDKPRKFNLKLNSARESAGDSDLSQCVSALLSNNIRTAELLLDQAKTKFLEEGLLEERAELLRAVEERVQSSRQNLAGNVRIHQSASLAIEQRRMLSLTQDADKLLAEAANAVGKCELAKAREMLEKASQFLESAGYNARRDRENIMGNLYTSILIEEERNVAKTKQKARRAKEDQFHQEALKALQSGKSEMNLASVEADRWNDDDLIILVDNGSSKPKTTLNLRRLAHRLSDDLGIKVCSEAPCLSFQSLLAFLSVSR